MKCTDCGAEIPPSRAACPNCLKSVFQKVSQNSASKDAELKRIRDEVDGVCTPTPRSELRPNRDGIAIWLLFTVLFVSISFTPEAHHSQVRAFGKMPLGVPVQLFVVVLQIVVLAPFALVTPHLLRIIRQFKADDFANDFGLGFNLAFIKYLFVVGKKHPDLITSQRRCALGFIYFVLILTAWIIYAAYRGI